MVQSDEATMAKIIDMASALRRDRYTRQKGKHMEHQGSAVENIRNQRKDKGEQDQRSDTGYAFPDIFILAFQHHADGADQRDEQGDKKFSGTDCLYIHHSVLFYPLSLTRSSVSIDL